MSWQFKESLAGFWKHECRCAKWAWDAWWARRPYAVLIPLAGVIPGALFHLYLVERYPWAVDVIGKPKNELAIAAVYTLPVLLLASLMFAFFLVMAPSKIHSDIMARLQKEKRNVAQLRESQKSPFGLSFSRVQTCESDREGGRRVYDLRVRLHNRTPKTVDRVALTSSYEVLDQPQDFTGCRDAEQASGRPLCLTSDSGLDRTIAPRTVTTMHANATEDFTLLRIGEHHSHFVLFSSRGRAHRSPTGKDVWSQDEPWKLTIGKYRVTVVAQATDCEPATLRLVIDKKKGQPFEVSEE